MRDLLAVAPSQHHNVIQALIRAVVSQPDHDRAAGQLRQVVAQLGAERVQAVADHPLPNTGFLPTHWCKILSTNPISSV